MGSGVVQGGMPRFLRRRLISEGSVINPAIRIREPHFGQASGWISKTCLINAAQDFEAFIDRYILSKLGSFIETIDHAYETYDLSQACEEVLQFIDALNNWFIRRSRDRFWKKEKDSDKTSAYNTLYTVLVTVTQCIAPLLPLITEEIYQGLTGEKSVHLSNFPRADCFPKETELVAEMDRIREVCSSALRVREAHDLRIRLPLKTLTIASSYAHSLKKYSEIIKEELNVKEVICEDSVEKFASFKLDLNSRKLGPKLGSKMKEILSLAKAGNWKSDKDGVIVGENTRIDKDDFTLALIPKEGVSAASLQDNSAVVILDTIITEDLAKEGTARDVVRAIQQARKTADLHISDTIELYLNTDETLRATLEDFSEYIKEQTLASSLSFNSEKGCQYSESVKIDAKEIIISLNKSTHI